MNEVKMQFTLLQEQLYIVVNKVENMQLQPKWEAIISTLMIFFSDFSLGQTKLNWRWKTP
jgi:hypothetical protein